MSAAAGVAVTAEAGTDAGDAATSIAWVLDLGYGRLAAVGEREQFHLMYGAQPFEVPVTPPHCRSALMWAGEPVPVVDLGVWLDGAPSRVASGFLGMYGYQDGHPGPDGPAVRFGALWLSAPPRRVAVADSAARPAPAKRTRLHDLSLAWFEHAGAMVAVIDLAAAFAPPRASE